MKRSRFDVPPAANESNDSLKTLSHDIKRKRCEAESLQKMHHEREQESMSGGQQQISEQTTLWMGDLERWEDEAYLVSLLGNLLPPSCKVVNLKIVRDYQTNFHLGYGFIDFDSNSAAMEALELLRRSCRPGHNRFKICWAATNTHKAISRTSSTAAVAPFLQHPYRSRDPSYQLYDASLTRTDELLTLHLGCLDRQITEHEIMELLKNIGYVSVAYVRISRNENGENRGFGFVKFMCPLEFRDAFQRLQGLVLGRRQVQVSVAYRNEQRVIERSSTLGSTKVSPETFGGNMLSTWNWPNTQFSDWTSLREWQCQKSLSSCTTTSSQVTDVPASELHTPLSTRSSHYRSNNLFHHSHIASGSSNASTPNTHPFCSGCCGDCALKSIETGFRIYDEDEVYDEPFVSAEHFPSSLRASCRLVSHSLLTRMDSFRVTDTLMDSFQYIFS